MERGSAERCGHSKAVEGVYNPVQCGEVSHWFVVEEMVGVWQSKGRIMGGGKGRTWRSVDPGHRNPLAGGAHQIHGLFQVPDGLVDLVVDNGLVKVVGVGLLQDLRLFLQPLQRFVLVREE